MTQKIAFDVNNDAYTGADTDIAKNYEYLPARYWCKTRYENG